MDNPETVKIRVTPCDGNEAGIVIINKSDYDPEKHELVGAKKKDDEGGKAASKKDSAKKKDDEGGK